MPFGKLQGRLEKIKDHSLVKNIRAQIDSYKDGAGSPQTSPSASPAKNCDLNSPIKNTPDEANPRGKKHAELSPIMKSQFVKALLYGLSWIPKTGTPGRVGDSGNNSFCVAVTNKGDCIEAAALFGSGRMVVFGHNGYMVDVNADGGDEPTQRRNRLMLNAALWAGSADCAISNSTKCAALCETKTSPNDFLNYPFEWGLDCQQPLTVGAIGFDNNAYEKSFKALDRGYPGIFKRGTFANSASLPNIQKVVNTRPDVILWKNSDVKSEITDTALGSTYLDERAEELLYYMQQGGGLVLALCPWGWESLSHKSVINNSLFNAVASRVGLTISADYATGFSNNMVSVEHSIKQADQPTAMENVRSAIVSISSQPQIKMDTLTSVLNTYMNCPAASFLEKPRARRAFLPDNDSDLRNLNSQIQAIALTQGQQALSFPITVGKGASSVSQSQAAALLYVAWLRQSCDILPPQQMSAYVPKAETFPGSCGTGTRNTNGMVASLLSSRSKWQSVGIYVPPGEPVILTISDQALAAFPNLDLQVQIGAHTDKLPLIKDDMKLSRHPRVVATRKWSPRTRASSPDAGAMAQPANSANSIAVGSLYGGTLYIQILGGVPGSTAPTPISIHVVGGVPMLLYSHLKERRVFDATETRVYGAFNQNTDQYPFWSSTWEQRAATFTDAPWAELEGRYVALVVPTAVAQKLTQTELWELMDFWDTALYSELTLSHQIDSYQWDVERLACDKQISAGYMHSGYPVMCFLDVVTPKGSARLPQLLDLPGLKKYPMWGFYHEFGHNRQKPAWTWDGMTEVTTNIFSLYCCKVMNGYGVYDAPWFVDQTQNILKFLRNGSATYNDYIKDAGIALGAFGVWVESIGSWDKMSQVFNNYKTKNINPKSNDDKINEWIKQTSLVTGMDLRPYYKQWHWPIKDSYLQDINGLPKWSGSVLRLMETKGASAY